MQAMFCRQKSANEKGECMSHIPKFVSYFGLCGKIGFICFLVLTCIIFSHIDFTLVNFSSLSDPVA